MEEAPEKKPKLTTTESKDKPHSQKQSNTAGERTTPSGMSTFAPPRGQHPTQPSYHLKASLLEEVINEKKMALMSSPAVLNFLRNSQEKVKKRKYGDLNISSSTSGNTVASKEQKVVSEPYASSTPASAANTDSKEGFYHSFQDIDSRTMLSKNESVILQGSLTDDKITTIQSNVTGQQTVTNSGGTQMSKSSASRKHNTRSQVALQKMLAKKGKLWSEGTSAFSSVTSNQDEKLSQEKTDFVNMIKD